MGPGRALIWLTVVLLAILFLGVALVARYHWISSAREALLAEEEKFKVIFENMQDAYILSRLDGTIVLVNPALVKMLGYGREADLLGKNTARDIFVDAEDRSQLRAKLMATGDVRGHKTTFKRADGTRVIVEGNVRLVRDERGAPVGVEGVVRDMTTHYQIRADLMEARDAAKAADARQVAVPGQHEPRDPHAAERRRRHGRPAPRERAAPMQRDYVETIRAVRRASCSRCSTTSSTSRRSRPASSSSSATSTEPASPRSSVRRQRRAPGQEGRWSFASTSRRRAAAPASATRAAAPDPRNLVANAVKFTEQGGVTSRSRSRRAPTPRSLLFASSDTGIGIAPARSAAVRDIHPGRRLDHPAVRRHGLGLAICRQVVRRWAASWRRPACPARAARSPSRAPSASSAAEVASGDALRSGGRGDSFLATPARRLRGSRVLLVEDNAINQQVAREFLEAAGVAVSIADNGRAAVDVVAASGGALDVILMDLQMPGMGGVEATLAIRYVARHGQTYPSSP